MNDFEEKLPTHETGIEKIERDEVQQEQLRESVFRGITQSKRDVDSLVESKTRAAQGFLSSLERTVREQEIQKETVISNPEEILKTVQDNLVEVEHLTTDDISRVLITSGLEMRDIESWLTIHKSELQLLSSRRKNLEARQSELSLGLIQEEQKNFFAKLLRGKERSTIASQLREVSRETAQIDTALGERQSRGNRVESATQEIILRRQELAFNATQQLLRGIVESYQQFKKN